MTPLAWGIVIGFVGGHVIYFTFFAYVWYRTIHKDHREPEQINADFLQLRDQLRRRRSDAARREGRN